MRSMSFDPGIYRHSPRYGLAMAIRHCFKQGRKVGAASSLPGRVVVPLVAVLALLMGCTDPGRRASQESQVNPESEYSADAAGSRAVESKMDLGVFSEFYGNWLIVGSSCPGICAMSEEEAESWVGLTVTLKESAVVFGDYACHDAAYKSRQVSRLDFFKSSRFDLKELGILAEEVPEVQISCNGQEWTAPGGIILIKDRENLVSPWDGVYFEMKRDLSAPD